MVGPIDLFTIAGQSNPKGRGIAALAPATVAGMAHEYRYVSDTIVTPVVEPMGLGTGSLRVANTGTLGPAFLNAFTAETDRPACLVHGVAVAGTGLTTADTGNGTWSPAGTLTADAVTYTLEAMAALTAAGWTPTLRGFLWHQGETDGNYWRGNPTTGEATYKAALIDLYDRLGDGLALGGLTDPFGFYVMRLGTHPTYETGFAAIRRAQDAAAAETDGMHIVYTRCKDFFTLGWMQADNLHYTQDGLNDMGTLTGQTVAAVLAGGGVTPPPPAPPVVRTSLTAARLLEII